MTAEAWDSYLAAARDLDTARRAAGGVVASQDRAVLAARDELAAVRRTLAPQQERLRALGATDTDLTPPPAEVAAVAVGMAAGPEGVIAALRRVKRVAEAADATLPSRTPRGPRPVRIAPSLRNLAVYGPLAVAVLVVQLVLYVAASPESLPLFALVFGVSLPMLAFGLGWWGVGLAYPAPPGGEVRRTPLLGLFVCFSPAALTCMGVGLIALLR